MDNYKRMIELVTEFFGTRSDPDQISVTPSELKHLQEIHPNTMAEVANADGPILWLLVLPTTTALMEQFIAGKLTEKQLLDQTPVNTKYEALYLCSVYVLPEFRQQGLSKKTIIDTVNAIMHDHNITALFYWPFSDEGKSLAITVAKELGLTLFERPQ